MLDIEQRRTSDSGRSGYDDNFDKRSQATSVDRVLYDATNTVRVDRVLYDSANTPNTVRHTNKTGSRQKVFSVDRAPCESADTRNENRDLRNTVSADPNQHSHRELNVPDDVLLINTDPDLPEESPSLPSNVLEILGEDPNTDKPKSYTLHHAICSRWSFILSNGLPKEDMSELTVRHNIPHNCNLLSAPKINLEVEPALTQAYLNRDNCYRRFQDHLGKGLSALGKGINSLLELSTNKECNQASDILPHLVDAGRILTGLFHDISITRRNLITNTFSRTVKETAETTQPDEFLFGREFGEKVKTAQNLEKNTLITGGRLQTISLIRVSNIISREKEIQISITDPIKTTMSLRAQPYLHIPFFLANKNVCPASTLMKYIDATKHLRQDEDFLFITYSGKHRRASKQTISRWVKSTLKEAGIDTAIFKLHSTRHSSTSAANRAGVSMEEICNTAGWSQGTSTFAKFYNRPLQETQRFAQAILISTQQEHT
nr:unnamed protein product [Callosobruchus analis]